MLPFTPVDVFSALADPVRRELLTRLAAAPARVVDLAADQPISRPAISRHLRVLTDAGLASATDAGRERHYALRTEPLTEVDELLGRLRGHRPPVSQQTWDALATEVARTARDRRASARRPSLDSQEEIA